MGLKKPDLSSMGMLYRPPSQQHEGSQDRTSAGRNIRNPESPPVGAIAWDGMATESVSRVVTSAGSGRG